MGQAYSPAAHAFLTQHRWASDVVAVLNLESSGPGGYDLLFQAAGAEAIAAYIKAAPHPHAHVCAQDLFRLGAVPADTDFTVFSDRRYGPLLGIDIATILDGEAYHTREDTYGRIQPGSLQVMGENALAVALELSAAFSAMPAGRAKGGTSAGSYFDVLGLFMVHYRREVAVVLHSVWLLPSLVAPLAVRRVYRLELPAAALYAAVLRGSATCLAAAASAILGSGTALALASLLAQKGMGWYGRPAVALLVSLPAAGAGLIYPYSRRLEPGRELVTPGTALDLCGTALLTSVMSAVTVHTGPFENSGFLLLGPGVFCVGAAILPALLGRRQCYLSSSALVLALAAVPSVLQSGLGTLSWVFITGRLGVTGSLAIPDRLTLVLPELALGAIAGSLLWIVAAW